MISDNQAKIDAVTGFGQGGVDNNGSIWYRS